MVYKDENVTVRAIAVKHGSWPQAFGYAIDAGGPKDRHLRRYAPNAVHHRRLSRVRRAGSRGVFRGSLQPGIRSGTRPVPSKLSHINHATRGYSHRKAKPKLLVLYHQLYFGDPEKVDLVKEIHRTYSGVVVNGRDLTEY